MALRSHEMAIGTVAATGIYCDIYDALDGDMDYASRDFSPLLTRRPPNALAEVNAFVEGEGNYPGAHVASGVKQRFKKHSDLLKVDVLKYGVRGWNCSCSTNSMAASIPNIFISSRLLHALPILPAYMLEGTSVKLQRMVAMFCSNMQLVSAAAHLYQAGRFSGISAHRGVTWT